MSLKDVESASDLGDDKGHQRMSYRDSLVVAQVAVQVRLGFLRKVYGILSVQLVLTIFVCSICMNLESVKSFVQTSPGILGISSIATFILLIALMVKRHEHPTNIYLLLAFTLVEAYTVGVVVTFYDKLVVLEAFILTAAVFVGLTVYTLQSKKDYSTWGACLFSFLWILIMGGLFQFFVQSEALEFVLCLAGAVVFSGFIIFDTHIMMTKLSPEEYIMAAINLYLDAINLFMYILRILSSKDK
ncbi:protein lifeguard 4-like [Corticium candelabrum]|uniref:protein lifeguard 4-like n=1 Tax=Corticium candelabrum TaxID=121492 RepID=UPI002E2666AA|nr:protein lifeguard 4-like [Corticium candelabrum]